MITSSVDPTCESAYQSAAAFLSAKCSSKCSRRARLNFWFLETKSTNCSKRLVLAEKMSIADIHCEVVVAADIAVFVLHKVENVPETFHCNLCMPSVRSRATTYKSQQPDALGCLCGASIPSF